MKLVEFLFYGPGEIKPEEMQPMADSLIGEACEFAIGTRGPAGEIGGKCEMHPCIIEAAKIESGRIIAMIRDQTTSELFRHRVY